MEQYVMVPEKDLPLISEFSECDVAVAGGGTGLPSGRSPCGRTAEMPLQSRLLSGRTRTAPGTRSAYGERSSAVTSALNRNHVGPVFPAIGW